MSAMVWKRDRIFAIVGLEEDLLMEIQDGLRSRIKAYQADIEDHTKNCQPDMCMKYEKPRPKQDCREDLEFLGAQIARIGMILNQIKQHGL
jgi:hypothetical protein